MTRFFLVVQLLHGNWRTRVLLAYHINILSTWKTTPQITFPFVKYPQSTTKQFGKKYQTCCMPRYLNHRAHPRDSVWVSHRKKILCQYFLSTTENWIYKRKRTDSLSQRSKKCWLHGWRNGVQQAWHVRRLSADTIRRNLPKRYSTPLKLRIILSPQGWRLYLWTILSHSGVSSTRFTVTRTRSVCTMAAS